MPKVLTIGEPLIRLTFDKNPKYFNDYKTKINVGGDTLNVALFMSNLGNEVDFFSLIPEEKNNIYSSLILKQMYNFRVKFVGQTMQSSRVGFYSYLEGNQFQDSVVFYDREHSSYSMLKEIKILKEYDLIHLSGISIYPNDKLRKVLLDFLKQQKIKGTKISFDINYRKKLWSSYADFKKAVIPFLEITDFCFGWINESDEFNSVDFSTLEINDFEKLTNYTWNKFNFDILSSPIRIIKNHKKHFTKAYGRNKHNSFLVDGIEFEPLFPIGAGDSFTGAFLDNILKTNNLNESLEIARNAYAIKHLYPGDENIFKSNDLYEMSKKTTKRILR